MSKNDDRMTVQDLIDFLNGIENKDTPILVRGGGGFDVLTKGNIDAIVELEIFCIEKSDRDLESLEARAAKWIHLLQDWYKAYPDYAIKIDAVINPYGLYANQSKEDVIRAMKECVVPLGTYKDVVQYILSEVTRFCSCDVIKDYNPYDAYSLNSPEEFLCFEKD